MSQPTIARVKALAFDVFGTVVDWRGTIIREGQALNATKDLSIDWAAFADAWRARYRPNMDRVARGELPWMSLDALHRRALDEVLAHFGVTTLSEDEKQRLNRVWHRLDPWPDAVPGLTRLRRAYILATLSNGNVALLVNMARRSTLPWDCILSAELVRAYKPDPRVYRMAHELLALAPDEVLLVAAHPADLRAARASGLRTAYIPRPLEHGPTTLPEPVQPGEFDVAARDFGDLAGQLGA